MAVGCQADNGFLDVGRHDAEAVDDGSGVRRNAADQSRLEVLNGGRLRNHFRRDVRQTGLVAVLVTV